jgi:hypothetical protein
LCRTLAKGEAEAAREYLHHAAFDVLPQALPEKLEYREALNRGGSATETDDELLRLEAEAVMHGVLKKVDDVVARLPAPSEKVRKEAQ